MDTGVLSKKLRPSIILSFTSTVMPSAQFSHLTQSELKAALLSRLNAAANLKKESRQLRKRLMDVRSELFAIEFELKQIQKLLGVKIIWREK